ncbi:MAG: ATP-binding protein [Simkaniaceae bacterium]|nr:ATP-binding protein [Simkaniaceae bacterium]
MIIGREKELSVLKDKLFSDRAEFLAIYGRRRIGKTFLVHEFFQDKGLYLEITGSHGASKKEQIKNFVTELKILFSDVGEIKDWSDAFDFLLKEIKKIDPSKKIILFIDELPWFAAPKSGFLRALDYFWNRHLSRFPNVLLIVCGSAAHWIIKKVIQDKGGLHNRLSGWIRLEPFTLSEVENYLTHQHIQIKRKQLIELYMVFGGVAKYLTGLPTGKSVVQIINEYCFKPSGYLFSEFKKLYESLFDGSETHMAIVKALAKKQHGLTQTKLLQSANLSPGGSSTTVLQELEESGFIMSMNAFGKQNREKVFRLIDEYSLFYLTWIDTMKGSVFKNSDPEYWHKKYRTPAWQTWVGHAFENICMKHSHCIKKALGISGITTSESHWQYVPKKDSKERGAEIDLVIDRADHCINLCEIKFCEDEFEITQSYAKILEQKKEVFQKHTKTKKTIFLTMITPFGLKPNKYSVELIHQQLTLDALF